jgi:hypothetical protein
MMFRAELTYFLMNKPGMFSPLNAARVSNLIKASRGELAWMVERDPSWPVFMAWNMSITSPPLTSPTIIRSGRILKLFLTRSR